MNRILVTGGTGNLGSQVVDYLLKQHDNVTILTSRNDVRSRENVLMIRGDLESGDGLLSATAEADMIIHCASNPKRVEQVDIDGTRNLLRSISRERTQHFLYISIVGVDKANYAYYRAKYAVEEIIAKSGIPFTILRTTQFHGFVLNLLQSFMNEQPGGMMTIPAGMKFQSVDIREVARRLTGLLREPSGLLPDFGGPEVLSFEDMARSYLDFIKAGPKLQLEDSQSDRINLFRSGVNLCPGHADGKMTWQSFLEEQFRNS